MKIKLIVLACFVFAALGLAGCAGGIEGEGTTVASTTKTISGTLVLPSEEEAAANLAVKSLGLLPHKALNAENVVTITVSNPVTGEELGSAVRDNSTGAWSVTIENSKIDTVLDPDDATRAALKITGSSDYDSVRQIADHPVTTTGVDTSETNYDTDMAASMLDDTDVDGLYDIAGIVAGARTAKKAIDTDCVTLVEDALKPTPSADGALCAARLAQDNENSENMQTVLCRMNAVRKKIMNCLSANRVPPSAVIPRFSRPEVLNKAMTRMDTLLSDTEREALLAKAVELCPTSVSEAGMRAQINMLKDAPFKNFNQGFANLTGGSAELKAQIKAATGEDAAKAMAYTILAQEMSTVSGGTYGSDHLNRLKEGMKGTFERGEYGKIVTGGVLMGTVVTNGFFDDSFKEMMGDPSKMAGIIDTLMAVDTTGFSRTDLRTYGGGIMDVLDTDGAFTGVMDEAQKEALVGMVGTGLRQGTITDRADLQSQAEQYVTNYRQYGDQIHQGCDSLATAALQDACRLNYIPQGNAVTRPLFAVTTAQLGGCGDEVVPALTCAADAATLFGGNCDNPEGNPNADSTFTYRALTEDPQIGLEKAQCLCERLKDTNAAADRCISMGELMTLNGPSPDGCDLGLGDDSNNSNNCHENPLMYQQSQHSKYLTCWEITAATEGSAAAAENTCKQYAAYDYNRDTDANSGTTAGNYNCQWGQLDNAPGVGCHYNFNTACTRSPSSSQQARCAGQVVASCLGLNEVACYVSMYIISTNSNWANCQWTGAVGVNGGRGCQNGNEICKPAACLGTETGNCRDYDGNAAQCALYHTVVDSLKRNCRYDYGANGRCNADAAVGVCTSIWKNQPNLPD